jgi:lipoprotein NlpI
MTIFALVSVASPLAAQVETPRQLLGRAAKAAGEGNSEQAVDLATLAIGADPTLADAFYLRGRENFRLGQVERSVADFDKYVALRPDAESRQWERGIALYYAGQFERGAKQFELYQTFHDSDVENSVWRYLCVARADGVEKARETMLPIENDPRVPMMQIYEMYRGKLKPDDVLAAARAGDPDAETLAGRMFYADLYLGLYHEAAGNAELARKHILASAGNDQPNPRVNRYMWDVARIHAERLNKSKK